MFRLIHSSNVALGRTIQAGKDNGTQTCRNDTYQTGDRRWPQHGSRRMDPSRNFTFRYGMHCRTNGAAMTITGNKISTSGYTTSSAAGNLSHESEQRPETSTTEPRQNPSANTVPRQFAPSIPRWLWTKVADGIDHRPARGVLAMAAGQAYNFKSSESFHDFLENHILKDAEKRPNPTAPISYFFGSHPFIVILDDRDLAALHDHSGELTQGPHGGISPLGALGDLFTEKNILLLDKFIKSPVTGETERNKEYSRQISLIKNFTTNKGLLNGFAVATMPSLINNELKKASQSENGVALKELVTNLAVKNGLMLILGVKEDDYYIKNRDFFDNVLEKLGDPKLFFNQKELKTILDGAKEQAIAFSAELIRDNYDKLTSNSNLIVKAWESLFKGDPKCKTFPKDFAAFEELRTSGTKEQKEMIEDYLRNIAFVGIASSETTAQALHFGIHELLNRPEWVEKIRHEVAQNDIDKMTLNTMTQFPALSAFVAETLDLHSPVSIAPYVATQDFDVVLSGRPVSIPEGTVIVKHLQRANRASLPDGNTFDPSRYLSPNTESSNQEANRAGKKFNVGENTLDLKKALDNLGHDQQKFHTFSDPGRPCPGRYLSVVELMKTFGKMVGDYDLSAKDADGNDLASVSLDCVVPGTRRVKQQVNLVLTEKDK
jgi:cytochrome P450